MGLIYYEGGELRFSVPKMSERILEKALWKTGTSPSLQALALWLLLKYKQHAPVLLIISDNNPQMSCLWAFVAPCVNLIRVSAVARSLATQANLMHF